MKTNIKFLPRKFIMVDANDEFGGDGMKNEKRKYLPEPDISKLNQLQIVSEDVAEQVMRKQEQWIEYNED